MLEGACGTDSFPLLIADYHLHLGLRQRRRRTLDLCVHVLYLCHAALAEAGRRWRAPYLILHGQLSDFDYLEAALFGSHLVIY